MIKIAAGLFLGLLLTSSLVQAQQLQPKKAQGMHHLSITSEPTAPKQDPMQPEPKKAEETKADKTERPAPAALKPAEALKKMDGLTEWPYYADLMTIGNDMALEKVMHAVDLDPGSVPPKGLFYLAKALSERKRYEEAAFYFYAGQLRATFDAARFPPYELNESKKPTDKRTEDQRGQVPEKGPEMVNPLESISVLSIAIGAPISKWAMSDPSRLDSVMTKVRTWDLATPYAYLPDYDMSHALPYESWPQLLTKTRSDYFTRVRQISQGLTAIRPAEPTRNFSAP